MEPNISKIIPDKESITVEFKSDLKRLPDRDLIAAVVCRTDCPYCKPHKSAYQRKGGTPYG